MKVFVLVQEGINDGCDGSVDLKVFDTLEKAQAEFEKKFNELINNFGATCIDDLDSDEDTFDYEGEWVYEKMDNSVSIYVMGDFSMNHEELYIDIKEVF